MTEILMPKATAVWLIDNTSLSFKQIADFCGLHPLEVKGIADGDVAAGVRGADPISNGQLTRDEIGRAENVGNYALTAVEHEHADKLSQNKKKAPRYTPLSRRQDRPDAIAWMVRNHPEIPDSQIAKLIGTTKTTINAVRDRTHWNTQNIKPVDPVALGLCAQSELDAIVQKAAEKKRREDAAKGIKPEDEGDTLKPATETGGAMRDPEPVRKAPETVEELFGESPKKD